MRHRNKVVKLKRKTAHRHALLANLACSLIEHGRIRTTLGKAKALRPVAEKLVTLAKKGDLHARRQAIAALGNKESAKRLFEIIVPLVKDRQGGYCRIVKLGPRQSDAAPMAIIEWTDMPDIDYDEDMIDEVDDSFDASDALLEDTTATAEEAEEAEEEAEEEETEEEAAKEEEE